MKRSIKKNLQCALGALMVLAYEAVSASAQCAMCRANLQASTSASANPQAVADALNLAVLVLLIPPVLIFSALFLVLLRYGRGGDDEGRVKNLKAAGAFD